MPELSAEETILCVGALEYAANDLKEGAAAAANLGRLSEIDKLMKVATEMRQLREKLLR